MLTTANTRALRRLVLALVACVGITACSSSDPSNLTCKELSSNPAGLDAMSKVAMSDPAITPYINPANNFGGGGQEAAGAGVDEGGLTNEFKNQVGSICSGADPSTKPYATALGNTESFARTGTRTPATPAQTPANPDQGSSGSGNGPASGQSSGSSSPASGGSSGGGGSGQGSGGGGTSGSGSPSNSGPADSGSGGSQPSGSQGSSPPSGGTPSGGSSSPGSGGSGSGGSGSSSGGNQGIPPCQPPSCAY